MSRRDYWTQPMMKGWRRLPLKVMIAVRPRIVRHGPPQIGALFFDRDGRLIYIIKNSGPRTYIWRRVLTNGTLDTEEHTGEWDWGEGTHDKEHRAITRVSKRAGDKRATAHIVRYPRSSRRSRSEDKGTASG